MDIDYMKFSSVMYDTLTRFQISEFLNPPIFVLMGGSTGLVLRCVDMSFKSDTP